MNETFSVFGSSGFVGQALVDLLQSQAHRVNRPRRNFDPKSHSADLGHIIYCAGVTTDFPSQPFNVVEAHVTTMSRLLEYGRFSSFMYLSTTRIFERSQISNDECINFSVNPFESSDFYNLSKLLGEALILNCQARNAKVVRLAYLVNYEPNSHDEVSNFVRAAQFGKVRIDAHPETQKNYVLLREVIPILPLIAIHGRHRLYNLASRESTSMFQIGACLERLAGCEVLYNEAATKRLMPPIDISISCKEFGFTPTPLIDYLCEVTERSS